MKTLNILKKHNFTDDVQKNIIAIFREIIKISEKL